MMTALGFAAAVFAKFHTTGIVDWNWSEADSLHQTFIAVFPMLGALLGLSIVGGMINNSRKKAPGDIGKNAHPHDPY